MKEKLNRLDIQTQKTIEKGAEIYNSLRSSLITTYGQTMPLEDKKCLAMYLGIIQSDNFFRKILKQLNYGTYISYELRESVHDNFNEEFYKLFNPFISDNCLEIITLYLLEQPVIKKLNEKAGYSYPILKTAVYDWMNQKYQCVDKKTVKTQKVLTK